eukprot:5623650-Prymnesium_polylepis.2
MPLRQGRLVGARCRHEGPARHHAHPAGHGGRQGGAHRRVRRVREVPAGQVGRDEAGRRDGGDAAVLPGRRPARQGHLPLRRGRRVQAVGRVPRRRAFRFRMKV